MSKIDPSRFCAKPSDAAELRAEVEAEATRIERGDPKPAAPTITPKESPLAVALEEVLDPATGGTKLIGRCPACAEDGHDELGRHLVVYQGGKFGCARFLAGYIETPAREKHLKRIWQLAGGKTGGFAKPPSMPPAVRTRRLKMIEGAKTHWVEAMEAYAMTMEDWQKTSADLPGSPEADFRFAANQYRPDELGWFGHRHEGSAVFGRHLVPPRTDTDRVWAAVNAEGLDHTSGAVYRPGSVSRHGKNHIAHVYRPIEHDGLPIEGQIALTRYMQALGLRLILCVHTGNRGFHSWFDGRGLTQERAGSIAFFLHAIGADDGAFSRASTRTPGAIRQNQFDGKPFGMPQPIIYIPTP